MCKIKLKGKKMIKPKKINFGDTIGIVAPSNPIIGDNIEEINLAKKKIENLGFKVEFSKNLLLSNIIYSLTICYFSVF